MRSTATCGSCWSFTEEVVAETTQALAVNAHADARVQAC